MENSNRNDVVRFFEDMPTNQQQEAICKLNKQIKKPVEIEQVELTDIFVGQ